jgi:hypothetical protein
LIPQMANYVPRVSRIAPGLIWNLQEQSLLGVIPWEESDPLKYEADDPRSWRNTCDETRKLIDLLAEWRINFETLKWVAFWGKGGWPRYGWMNINRRMSAQ